MCVRMLRNTRRIFIDKIDTSLAEMVQEDIFIEKIVHSRLSFYLSWIYRMNLEMNMKMNIMQFIINVFSLHRNYNKYTRPLKGGEGSKLIFLMLYFILYLLFFTYLF